MNKKLIGFGIGIGGTMIGLGFALRWYVSKCKHFEKCSKHFLDQACKEGLENDRLRKDEKFHIEVMKSMIECGTYECSRCENGDLQVQMVVADFYHIYPKEIADKYFGEDYGYKS